MKTLVIQCMETGEYHNIPIPQPNGGLTFGIYAGEIGNLRLFGYVQIEEAVGKQPPAMGIIKPAGIEWGDIKDGDEWCRPPVQVQPEPVYKVKDYGHA